MKANEVNQIIAEYMGLKVLTPQQWSERIIIEKGEICSDSIKIQYSLSLDRLVCVWEKISDNSFLNVNISSDSSTYEVYFTDLNDEIVAIYESDSCEAISLTAAVATAKVILKIQ